MLKRIAALLIASCLAACGGGGGSSGTAPFGSSGSGSGTGSTGGTTTAVPTVILSISSTSVTVAAPATVTATVRDATGALASGQIVTFSTSGSLGAFSASTALTNSSGVATVKLSPASSTSNGADLAIANVTVAGAPATGSIGFTVTSTSVTPQGTPKISIALSSTTVTSSAPATVTATITDAAGNPISGQVVTFSTVGNLGTFNPASALTGSAGTASVQLSPATATTNGADLAVATSTVSGTQVTANVGFSLVSTGAPATGAPSISLTLSNTLVTASTPATVTAVVRDATGVGLAGQVVKFSTVDGLGVFAVNSALTDATGTASVVLSAVGASQSGADQVIAAATVNNTALQASQGFQLTATSATISAFTSDVVGTLSAYGQANLTVTVAGAASGASVNLSVSSACVTSGKATLTPASATTTTGAATFTYRDNGCGATAASDTLQANIVGTSATQSLVITVASPTVSSIVFTSATPSTIYLKGSGLTETSTVVFTVVDTAGNGVPNQSVTLALLSASGGLTLNGGSAPVATTTDSLGHVTALINSGTVPTPVRVSATLVSTGISTVSSGLAVAVGLPSELNFSLSQKTKNIEGYDLDGTANSYNIIASDRLANPVPSTSINFIAEGGQVEPIKSTALVNGIATTSANFVSADPRPLDGRVTVLAYALGEESFLDSNGNNIWDSPPDSQFQDLGAVFLSRKYIDAYFSATDQLIPLSIPGVSGTAVCDTAAGTAQLFEFSPSIPTVGGSTCDGVWGRAYVRKAVETVLSTSAARLLWPSAPLNSNNGITLYGPSSTPTVAGTGQCTVVQDVTTDPTTPQQLIEGYDDTTGNALRPYSFYLTGANQLFNVDGSGTLSFLVADNNPVRLNPVAATSTISATASTGLSVTVTGGTPVANTTEVTSASVSYVFGSATSGTITVTVTSPSGVGTQFPISLSTGVPSLAQSLSQCPFAPPSP